MKLSSLINPDIVTYNPKFN